MSIWGIENDLVRGDPLDPKGVDLIAQIARVPVGQPVPDGWRVLTGSGRDSMIARVAFRFEVER